MRMPSSSELLVIWEAGLERQPVERGLVILAAACPEFQPIELARMSIGERDARLLTLRELIFGPIMDCLVACPECEEPLEMSIKVADIRVEPEEALESSHETLSFSLQGYEILFHLPNSLDLAALVRAEDVAEGRDALIESCIEGVSLAGAKAPLNQLPREVLSSLADRMVELDPQADVYFDLSCPSCGHKWQSVLDVLSFFWGEISAWARRTLWEVHALASAYGWSESEILALSPRRRLTYLEMNG